MGPLQAFTNYPDKRKGIKVKDELREASISLL